MPTKIIGKTMIKSQRIGFQINENRRMKRETTIELIMNPVRTVIFKTLRKDKKDIYDLILVAE